MVLAAGDGTRLGPLTRLMAKPMVDVAGRPAIGWIASWLRAHGVREIVVNLRRHPETLLAYLRDGRELGVTTRYSVEHEVIGTGGALRQAIDHLGDRFVLTYGDVLTDMNLGGLIAAHLANPARPCLTLALIRTDRPTECGLASQEPDGRVSRFVEKPAAADVFSDWANAGIMVVERRALQYIAPAGFCDLSAEVLPALIGADETVWGYRMDPTDYLIDMGTPALLERARGTWPTERFLANSAGR